MPVGSNAINRRDSNGSKSNRLDFVRGLLLLTNNDLLAFRNWVGPRSNAGTIEPANQTAVDGLLLGSQNNEISGVIARWA
jgi:hypothetical protein